MVTSVLTVRNLRKFYGSGEFDLAVHPGEMHEVQATVAGVQNQSILTGGGISGIVGVLNVFAVIALIAAGFGIINTLLMSVQERTRETAS